MFGDFFAKFGEGVKQVIFGMLLGLVLLPVGVLMQYCSATQMKYHKVFEDSKVIAKSGDIEKSMNVKLINNDFSLSEGPFASLTTPEGDTIEGQYISYSIGRKTAERQEVEKKDKNGNVIGHEYKYSWKSAEPVSSKTQSIKVSDFSIEFSNFKQRNIKSVDKYYKYRNQSSGVNSFSGVRGDSGNSKSGLLISNSSTEPKATKEDYERNNYLIVFDGYVYIPGAKITVAGFGEPGNSALTPVVSKKGVGGFNTQEMLAISYGGAAETYKFLENESKTEGFLKFIIGTICFIIGFSGIFGPIIKVLDFIPLVGDIAIGIIYFVLAIISLLLSILFWVFFKFFWLILILAIAIPLILFFINQSKKSAA